MNREEGAVGRWSRVQLGPRERAAARAFVRRVLREVDAELVQASLFGSRARGEARPDSDVDVLLVFRRLPPDREPQATHAEDLADQVAAATGVPVTAWSVSLPDLERGCRTPMLVDALDDSVPLWSAHAPLAPIRFTPHDGLWCAERLLERVEEGGWELADRLSAGDLAAAAKRGRDDVVRLCTALLLLAGTTRPRRAEAVRAARGLLGRLPARETRVLAWAHESFGADGRDEDGPVPQPPGGLPALRATVSRLACDVVSRGDRLHRRTLAGEPRGA
jgi:predicted nucleotidyltransferase